MATIKENLDRTIRGYTRVAGIATSVAIGIGIAVQAFGLPAGLLVVSILGVVLAVGTNVLMLVIGVRCPRCGYRLEMSYRTQLYWWSDIRYCPGCGIDFRQPDPDHMPN